jgi:tetratricopeptide (TPR) repeat protein
MKYLIVSLLILVSGCKSDKEKAEEYYNRGNSKYDLGDFNGAILDYNKAIELEPDNAFGYEYRGNSKYKLGDFNGACLDWGEVSGVGISEAYKKYKKYCIPLDWSKVGGLEPFEAYEQKKKYSN